MALYNDPVFNNHDNNDGDDTNDVDCAVGDGETIVSHGR